MGPPILEGPKVPTTLAPTREGSVVVQQDLLVDGRTWKVTAVSMGNPHAAIYSVDGKPVKASGAGGAGVEGKAAGQAATGHTGSRHRRLALGDAKLIDQKPNHKHVVSCIRTA
jgi:hypothetical protein